jgi:hypothetical protein
MQKMLLFTGMILLLCFSGISQGSGTVSGKVSDSTGKHPLSLATITVFKARDTTVVTYRLSNDKGEFKINNLPFNIPLRLLVTFSGYEAYRKEFSLSAANPFISMETISMTSTSRQLDEVIVVAERPPMVIRNDTVEFNAAAFKTLPNAVAEDLLKRLPGAMLDENGNLTFDGKRVNRILVDGKRFFGDNIEMATKNLPRSIIDKVQVTDDKDEIALRNDGDLSNIGKVVNLTLKKHVKKKWFGKLEGGTGTEGRYQLSANLHTFKDTLQVNTNTSLGNSNTNGNIETPRPGLSTNRTAGLNINYSPSSKLSYSAQYRYYNAVNELEQDNNYMRLLGDTSVSTHTISSPRNNTSSHNFSSSANWRKDSLTNINLSLNYSNSKGQSRTPSVVQIESNKLGLLSNGNTLQSSSNSSHNINLSFNLSHRWRHKRERNISMNGNFSYSVNPYYSTTESNNQFFYPAVYNQLNNQMRLSRFPNKNFSFATMYSDGFGKKWVLRLNNRFEYMQNDQQLFTYARPVASDKYDSLNAALSSSLQREQFLVSNMASIGYRIKKVLVSLNGTWQTQWVNNSFGVSSINNSRMQYSYLLPSLSINWKNYNLNISRNMTIPPVSYLLPVPDNSNPYFIRYGNPTLLPSRQTSINFNGNQHNVKTNFNLYVNGNISFTDNAIIQSTVLNSNGITVSTPVNVNGTMYSYISGRVTKQFRHKRDFILSTNLGLSANFSKSPIFYNGAQSVYRNTSLNPSAGIEMEWSDLVELNIRYAPSYSKTVYSNNRFPATELFTQTLHTEFTVSPHKKLICQSTLNYRYNGRVPPGAPRDNIYWTASLSRLLLKGDAGQLKLAVYDILNSNNAYSRYIGANTITDSRVNTLQRIFMLSFIYNIQPVVAARQVKGPGR